MRKFKHIERLFSKSSITSKFEKDSEHNLPDQESQNTNSLSDNDNSDEDGQRTNNKSGNKSKKSNLAKRARNKTQDEWLFHKNQIIQALHYLSNYFHQTHQVFNLFLNFTEYNIFFKEEKLFLTFGNNYC